MLIKLLWTGTELGFKVGGAKYKYKKAYENQNYHLLRIMHNPSEYFLVSILSVFNFQIFATAPAVKSPFSYDY